MGFTPRIIVSGCCIGGGIFTGCSFSGLCVCPLVGLSIGLLSTGGTGPFDGCPLIEGCTLGIAVSGCLLKALGVFLLYNLKVSNCDCAVTTVADPIPIIIIIILTIYQN